MISKHLNKVKKVYYKYKKDESYRARFQYTKYYEELSIRENTILLEASHGNQIDGNIFYILKELYINEEYKNFKVYLSVRKESKENILNKLKRYNIEGIETVRIHSDEYLKVLASSEFLINDTSFMPYFMKKKGQNYLNTWHGTPYKNLGKGDVLAKHLLGNVRRNFMMTDSILIPNEIKEKAIRNDYMLKDYKGSFINHGYPRNEVFFQEKNNEIIEKYELKDKEVWVYMPTWRGTIKNKNKKNICSTYHHLAELDNKLSGNQILFVKLHPFVNSILKISLEEEFKNIKPFPNDYETYDFLNVADGLISDYSSVIFDYANTGKKIILFQFDQDEYFKDRGTYLKKEEIPFPIVKDVESLFQEMLIPSKLYDKKSVFIKKICENENFESSKNICRHFLLGNKVIEEHKNKIEKKRNILIYAGNMAFNGITTSLLTLLSSVDLKKDNYYITFYQGAVKDHLEKISQLPEEVTYIPINDTPNLNFMEAASNYLYYKFDFKNKFITNRMDTNLKREIKRLYCGMEIDIAIHFSGYERKLTHLFKNIEGAKKIIYCHNDMVNEYQTRNNFHWNSIERAYKEYDEVAIVHQNLEKPCKELGAKNIRVVENTFLGSEIIEKSKEEINFGEDTFSNKPLEELKEILKSSAKKIVTIGRFSDEKGHMRLIEEFEKVSTKEKDIYLIIIGGNGVKFQETLERVNVSTASEKIIIIKKILNPFSILKYADGFILPSFYEGLGLVLIEAAVLGIPVVSADMPVTRKIVAECNGKIVSNDNEGIYHGLELLYKGKIEKSNFNYEGYNKKCVKQYYDMINL